MTCGCDNRRDIMFAQGNGHVPVTVLFIIGTLVILYII